MDGWIVEEMDGWMEGWMDVSFDSYRFDKVIEVPSVLPGSGPATADGLGEVQLSSAGQCPVQRLPQQSNAVVNKRQLGLTIKNRSLSPGCHGYIEHVTTQTGQCYLGVMDT